MHIGKYKVLHEMETFLPYQCFERECELIGIKNNISAHRAASPGDIIHSIFEVTLIISCTNLNIRPIILFVLFSFPHENV